MILTANMNLEAVLGGSVSANQPVAHVVYVDWNPQGNPAPPAMTRTALNNTTDVTILAAPVGNPTREVLEVNIFNADSASVALTLKTDDGTERKLITRTLTTLQTLNWKKNYPWTVIATS